VATLLRGVIALSERRAAFVSAVTHELRTPLTTFRMYAEMLSEGMVREESDRRHYLETLRVEADRLTHLVANVLAYARLERGRPGGRIVTVGVDRLLEIATQRLADRAAQTQLQLSIEPADNVLARSVQADPAAVEQILFNLVDNACKYATSAADRTLHLSVTADDGRVCIRLRDHGSGVPAGEERRLFRPFHKSARDAAHSAPGVGLGLALSQRLARDMHGDLQYEPVANGACFALFLPEAT
jgi:signal transduction histidine kinase